MQKKPTQNPSNDKQKQRSIKSPWGIRFQSRLSRPVAPLVETVHPGACTRKAAREAVQTLPYNIAYFSVHSLANLLYLIEQVYWALIITKLFWWSSTQKWLKYLQNSDQLFTVGQYISYSKNRTGVKPNQFAFFPECDN